MKKGFANGVVGAAPALPDSWETGYPTDGDPLAPTEPTIPGAYWFHMIAESLERVITQADLTPDPENLDLLKHAIMLIASTESGGGVAKVTTAAQNYAAFAQYVFPHTLGSPPMFLQLVARCKFAEGGFAVGDLVYLPVSHDDDVGSGADIGYVTSADANNIYLSLDTNHEQRFHAKNSPSRFVLTNSRWEYFFHAIA